MNTPTNSKGKHHLTIQILASMLIGALVGIGCNLVINHAGAGLADSLNTILVDGIFKLLGQAFLSLLQVIVVPLVFVSLVCGTASLDDIRKLGRIGIRTVLFYLMTTAIAISLALAMAIIVGPGKGFGLSTDTSFAAAESRFYQVF